MPFSYPLRMALSPSLLLSHSPHPSTFYIVLWLFKTLALESGPVLLIHAPKLPSPPCSLHSPLPAQQSWEITPIHCMESVALSAFLCPVSWVSSLPGPHSPFPNLQQLTHHCYVCLVICYVPPILLEGCYISRGSPKKQKQQDVHLGRDLLQGIGPHDYDSWEVPRTSVRKLGT